MRAGALAVVAANDAYGIVLAIASPPIAGSSLEASTCRVHAPIASISNVWPAAYALGSVTESISVDIGAGCAPGCSNAMKFVRTSLATGRSCSNGVGRSGAVYTTLAAPGAVADQLPGAPGAAPIGCGAIV